MCVGGIKASAPPSRKENQPTNPSPPPGKIRKRELNGPIPRRRQSLAATQDQGKTTEAKKGSGGRLGNRSHNGEFGGVVGSTSVAVEIRLKVIVILAAHVHLQLVLASGKAIKKINGSPCCAGPPLVAWVGQIPAKAEIPPGVGMCSASSCNTVVECDTLDVTTTVFEGFSFCTSNGQSLSGIRVEGAKVGSFERFYASPSSCTIGRDQDVGSAEGEEATCSLGTCSWLAVVAISLVGGELYSRSLHTLHTPTSPRSYSIFSRKLYRKAGKAQPTRPQQVAAASCGRLNPHGLPAAHSRIICGWKPQLLTNKATEGTRCQTACQLEPLCLLYLLWPHHCSLIRTPPIGSR